MTQEQLDALFDLVRMQKRMTIHNAVHWLATEYSLFGQVSGASFDGVALPDDIRRSDDYLIFVEPVEFVEGEI